MTPLSWDPTPGAHIYVDESTAGDYLLMGAAIASADAPQMRSVMPVSYTHLATERGCGRPVLPQALS